jgi:hypothetical protein
MNGLTALSPRDRRTLLIGGTIISTIVLVARTLPVWREWDERSRAEAVSAATELATLERGLALLPALRDSARARTARAEAQRARMIAGETVTVAGAALATHVTDIADDLGLRVESVQIRPDTVFRSGHARVAVRVNASGDVTHLTDLLSALEMGEELLAVRELTISPSDAFASDAQPEVLHFQLLVEGLAVQHAAAAR